MGEKLKRKEKEAPSREEMKKSPLWKLNVIMHSNKKITM